MTGEREVPTPALPTAAEEVRALLQLRLLPGVGEVTITRLLKRYGRPSQALRASRAELGDAAVRARDSARILRRLDRILDLNATGPSRLILWGAADYPSRFRQLHVPPLALWAQGRLELAEQRCVAVVGSRRHTAYGADSARRFAEELARAGLVVVSGLARGIDGHAHRAALSIGGATLAVLGCGIDVRYPAEHQQLQARIGEEGLLLSEFEPGTPPLGFNFPRRNRLMAALAEAIVVIEAMAKSGAIVTADHGLAIGRDVFVVPGPIGRLTSAGSNALLSEGAAPVCDPREVFAALHLMPPAPRRHRGIRHDGSRRRRPEAAPADGPAPAPVPPPGLTAAALRMWHLLEPEPQHIDALAAAAALGSPGALSAVLELELRGAARQLPGQRYMRV